MKLRVDINPRLITWARERAGLGVGDLGGFAKLRSWESGAVKPTFKQLERFAECVHAPIGYLLLSEPPKEQLPVIDVRAKSNCGGQKPSINLIDTIYFCERMQDWYQEFSITEGMQPMKFVGSASCGSDAMEVAASIREKLAMDFDEWRAAKSWRISFTYLIQKIEDVGVLVVVNDLVEVDSRRKLDPDEFRGLSFSDKMAPLIFVNGADAKDSQMFTLAHCLLHIWLGESLLSDVSLTNNNRIEKWCNKVAAELLIPADIIRHKYDKNHNLISQAKVLSNYFRVSVPVILYRLYDARIISKAVYAEGCEQWQRGSINSNGRSNSPLRHLAGQQFSRSVVEGAFTGQCRFTDAFRFLGVKSADALKEKGREAGMSI